MSVSLSILDLVRVTQGSDAATALQRAADLARHAEARGFQRLWYAEHHNMPGIASAATALLIGHVAQVTRDIRVGAGGIMLPNHAPLVIAEQFGTLARLYPGRIDLGLGRAPGTDRATLRALRRSAASAETFPDDVLELRNYFSDDAADQRIQAVPAAGTRVPLWILGSSTFGAAVAAEFGLPYAFASHFAPAQLHQALRVYRKNFKPSGQLSRPYAMVGVNVIAADTDTEARRLATTQQMSFVNLIRGTRGLSQPPIDSIDDYWTHAERDHLQQMLACSVVGNAKSVALGLEQLATQTEADELMLVTDVFDHEARLHSLTLTASACSRSGLYGTGDAVDRAMDSGRVRTARRAGYINRVDNARPGDSCP